MTRPHAMRTWRTPMPRSHAGNPSAASAPLGRTSTIAGACSAMQENQRGALDYYLSPCLGAASHVDDTGERPLAAMGLAGLVPSADTRSAAISKRCRV